MSAHSKRLLISAMAVCILSAGATVLLKSERKRAAASECLDNLALIDGAKQTWAFETQSGPDAKPGWGDICPYTGASIPSNACPILCPSGGTYVIGEVAHPAICSVHGFMFFVFDPNSPPESSAIPGAGVEGALVETLGSDGHKVKTTTNASGRALVKTPQNGTATVIISKPGYVTVSNSIGALYSNGSVALKRVRK